MRLRVNGGQGPESLQHGGRGEEMSLLDQSAVLVNTAATTGDGEQDRNTTGEKCSKRQKTVVQKVEARTQSKVVVQ